jgi:acetyl-CoA decarbonylase/synthase, CODH/ACS complex subunit gamma
MALTGLQIYKLLPRTNCGDCGLPTCLAFAMKIAANKAPLDDCPHASDEARETLGAASLPPIKAVIIGKGERQFEIGKEKVLFRHDETFYNPTALAIQIDDSLNEDDLKTRLEKIPHLSFERAGARLSINALALKETQNDASKYVRLVSRVAAESPLPLVLMSTNPEIIKQALQQAGSQRPLIYGATADNLEAMAAMARESECPLALSGASIDDLQRLSEQCKTYGVKELVLDSGARELKSVLHDQTQIRRMAVKKGQKLLGYPTITFACDGDPYQEMINLCTHICKYGGLAITSLVEPWQILPLLTLRQNIFTDPQKPIQVEPKLYSLGQVTENSPVLVTTNFSLTYFLVAGEVEASKIPAYLLIIDTEGTSVLTAWAADKFNAATIAGGLKKSGIEDMVRHRKILLPGYVAVLCAPLQKESGWEAIPGPKEASGIPSYLKSKGPSWSQGG